MVRLTGCLVALSLMALSPSLAQGPHFIEGPAASEVWEASLRPVEDFRLDAPSSPQSRLRLQSAPDYRWEGLVAGATLLGVGLAVMTNGLCQDPDGGHEGGCLGPTLGAGLVGATIGGVVGGLLGTLVPKPVDGS
jgi:hypothetical protein